MLLFGNDFASGGRILVNSTSLTTEATFTRASSAEAFVAGTLTSFATDVPRFGALNYASSLVPEEVGLVTEGAKTNLLTYSNPESTDWNDNLSNTRTPNAEVAPDGTTTAPTFNMAATQGSGAFTTLTLAADTAYTHSFFVKKISGSSNEIWIGSDQSPPWASGSSFTLRFNVTTKTFSSVGADVSSYGYVDCADDWIQVYMTGTTDGTGGFSTFFVYNNDAANSGVYAVWGAQIEASTFVSSYIATSGATAPRAADVLSITSLNTKPWWNNTEGTFVVGFKPNALNTTFGFLISATGGGDRIELRMTNDTTVQGNVVTSSTDHAIEKTITAGAVTKVAFAFADGDQAMSVNGGTVGTLSATLPTAMTSLQNNIAGAVQLNGVITDITYYPKRLPNAQLITLSVL